MRFRLTLVTALLGSVAILGLACSSSDYPNPYLDFTTSKGQEGDAFDDVVRFEIKRVDPTGKSVRVHRAKTLPSELDMGDSGTYQFVGTGYDADDKPVAIARTLTVSPGSILGSKVPMFFARTDRASRPLGRFVGTPKQNPVAGILTGRYLWFFDDSSKNSLKTDSYSVAYWEQVTPPDRYATITPCPETPCSLKNIVVIGTVFAFAISDNWALGIDTTISRADEYEPPNGLSSWGDIAGGRTLPGSYDNAIVVGPARQGKATSTILALSVASDGTILSSVEELSTKRARAAVIYEEDIGLVIAGGSSRGAGVERFDLTKTDNGFEELPYPADPTVGAALVMEDGRHVLRVGGLLENGDAAPTVRIDLKCSANCTYETVPELDLALENAQSFYDPETEQTLVSGENADGLTLVYRYRSSGFESIEFPKAQKRVRALALELPNQQLAIVGGTDPKDETASRQDISVIAF